MEGQTSSGLGWRADPMRGFNDHFLKLHGFLHVYKVRIQRYMGLWASISGLVNNELV